MDKICTPFKRTSDVCDQCGANYLRNLVERFDRMHAKQNEILITMESTFKDVLTTTNSLSEEYGEGRRNIKTLITKFEHIDSNMHFIDLTAIKETTKVLVQLKESDLLNENLLNFKLARDAFEKVYKNLDELSTKARMTKPYVSQSVVVKNSLRDRIMMFEKLAGSTQKLKREMSTGNCSLCKNIVAWKAAAAAANILSTSTFALATVSASASTSASSLVKYADAEGSSADGETDSEPTERNVHEANVNHLDCSMQHQQHKIEFNELDATIGKVVADPSPKVHDEVLNAEIKLD